MRTIGNVCLSIKSEGRQIRFLRTSCDGWEIIVPKYLISHCQEKLLASLKAPVPQTDTGR